MKGKQKGNRERVRKSGLCKKKKKRKKCKRAGSRQGDFCAPSTLQRPALEHWGFDFKEFPVAFSTPFLPPAWFCSLDQQHPTAAAHRSLPGLLWGWSIFLWEAGSILPSAWQTELGDTAQPATGKPSVLGPSPSLLLEQTGARCREGSLQAQVKCSLHRIKHTQTCRLCLLPEVRKLPK